MAETAVSVVEMPMEAQGIKLELHDLPETVSKGDIIYFKGKLTEDAKGTEG